MGEESNLGGYVKFSDAEWKPIAHITMDEITEPEDRFVTDFIRTLWREPIECSIKVLMQRKGMRKLYKHIGCPEYFVTEWLFPKKKKRGTARRKRKLRRYEQNFRAFIKEHYGSHMTGTRATHTIIDKFIISKDEFPAFAGPFEGEEGV